METLTASDNRSFAESIATVPMKGGAQIWIAIGPTGSMHCAGQHYPLNPTPEQKAYHEANYQDFLEARSRMYGYLSVMAEKDPVNS